MNKTSLGKLIEERAAIWLLEGHPARRLIARNYRCKQGELDLVLEEGGVELVFVEVRCRQGGSWIKGLESVTFPKQMRLRRAIAKFLATYRGPASSIRIDILSWDGKAFEHTPNIWFSWDSE